MFFYLAKDLKNSELSLVRFIRIATKDTTAVELRIISKSIVRVWNTAPYCYSVWGRTKGIVVFLIGE